MTRHRRFAGASWGEGQFDRAHFHDQGMQLNIPNNPGFRIRGTIVNFCADTNVSVPLECSY